MDFCKTFFSKSLRELKIEEIELYFEEGREETDQIEFKSISEPDFSKADFTGIHRAICAFLNSSGGVLVWGAPKSPL